MKKSFMLALSSAALLLTLPAHAEIRQEAARAGAKVADKKTDKAIIFQHQGAEKACLAKCPQ